MAEEEDRRFLLSVMISVPEVRAVQTPVLTAGAPLCLSPVQQRLCAGVRLQRGELPERVLPAAGGLQAAERDPRGGRRLLRHR